ncbi:hypothetical protein JAAARDRAFT_141594, partial [Jaapia argillacea MUCL 33604]
VADYPEQCLVTCAKSGTCPKCQCPDKELGESTPGASRTSDWTLNVIHSAQKEVSSKTEFSKLCMSQDVSGCVHRPFWEGFPFANIHKSMTPNVLHQLYQGVFKHLVTWCKSAMGSSELDKHIQCLLPSFGTCHFKNGISALSQISRLERKDMARILLACLTSKIPKEGIIACCSLLDFI